MNILVVILIAVGLFGETILPIRTKFVVYIYCVFGQHF